MEKYENKNTTYNKYICQEKEKQQYIAVSTVKWFMETKKSKVKKVPSIEDRG